MSDESGYGNEAVSQAVDTALANWEEVIADLEATAEEYREAGWEVMAIHPLDVVPAADEDTDMLGLELVVPDNEFIDLVTAVERRGLDFDELDVYRAKRDSVMFLVFSMKDATERMCLLSPAYYDIGVGRDMILCAHETGAMNVYLRRLRSDKVLTVSVDDPAEVLPSDSDP